MGTSAPSIPRPESVGSDRSSSVGCLAPFALLQRLADNRVFTLGVGSVAFLLVGALTFANTSDDPLITLRYAANLLHQGQPVFNLGERVEGYTSPLHLLLATALLLLPGGVALFKLKLLSLIFAAAALWQTARLADAVGLPRLGRLAAVIAVAGSWSFMVSASNGLETSLVALLATGAAASLAGEDSTRRWWVPGIWTGLLMLARPDAVVIIAALALASLAHRRAGPCRRRLLWLTIPVGALTALLAFRLLYYGQLLPNTYYAKHLALSGALTSGMRYLTDSQPLGGLGLGIVVLGLESWLVWMAAVRFRRARPSITYPLAVLLAQILVILGSGGDWMKGGRFFAPAVPAATIMVLLGVEAILTPRHPEQIVTRRRRRIAIAVVVLLLAPANVDYLAPIWRFTSGISDHSLIADGNYPLSPTWSNSPTIVDCLKPGQSVAYSEIGLFGYQHLDLRVIDTSGLTNARIARTEPASNKHPWGVNDPNWYLPSSSLGHVLIQARPEMIIALNDSRSTRPSNSILNGLYQRAAPTREHASLATPIVYVRVRGDRSCR